MGKFHDTLRELLVKIIGKESTPRRQGISVEDLRPNKHAEGWQKADFAKQAPASHPVSQAQLKYSSKQKISVDPSPNANRAETKIRDPYFFQIGFDFGTSTSKAIIRDINTDTAWVYTAPNADIHYPFLIPSVVIYRNGNFERHFDTDIFYPEGGLYHIKVAVENVAIGMTNNHILADYKRILGKNSPYKPDYITELSCIYLLSSVFSDIISSIAQKFSDYGKDKNDQIAINMAIPVSNISDKKVRLFFERILNISWDLAKTFNIFPKESVTELAKNVEECKQRIVKHGEEGLCHVYPEVSANVQAFVRSPASSPDITTIYFFSDAGAGTVDQSVFTYAGENGRRLNYFSAGVFPRGSSQIEMIACGDTVDESNLEYWRKEKEQGKESPPLHHAKMKVGEGLKADTWETLRETLKCLPFGEGGISPVTTLKEKIKFIFSGGGHTENPYHIAVIDAYKDSLRPIGEPIVTSMAHPSDLDVPKGCEHWMKRLYVAYGLSFLFHDLAENTFPLENQLEPAKTTLAQSCSCRGQNKNCSRCYGTGIIQ